MAINDIYLCQLELTTWDVNHSISFHVRDDQGQSEGDGANACAGDMDAQLTGDFRAILSSSTVLEAWYCRRVVGGPENPGLKQLNDLSGNYAGGAAAYPPNTCLVVSMNSEDPQQKRSSRFYLGGLPKNSITGGVWDGAWAPLADQLANNFKAQIVGSLGQWTPGTLRTIDNGVPLGTPIFIPSTSATAQPVAYSQRRRNSKSRGMSTAE